MELGRWKKLRDVFGKAAEARPPAAALWLDGLRVSDPATRERLLVLAAGGSPPDGGAAPPNVPSPARIDPPPPHPPRDAVPDRLGLAGRIFSHFQVLEPLSAGGMGIVYRAEDTQLRRRVALKFPLPRSVLDPVARERFLREARSAAALDHPNICTVYEVGEHEGQLFLAMPLYAGESCAARLGRDGAMPWNEAVAIVRQVALGLECAHQGGIVHRDLKPGNLMLLPDGTVKILDFGLAKSRESSLTESHAMLGTLLYMAPEQIRGARVSAATDLWALGAVLYEMLTGVAAFRRDNPYAVIYAVLNDEPVRLDRLPPGLPDGVESILARLLDKDAAQRYSSATALLEVLGRRVEEEATGSAVESPVQLPTTATPLIGRGAEILQIHERLRDADSRIVTVVGSGGVGKTRLAIEAAGAIAAEFRDGVRFVPLAQTDPGEPLDAALTKLLGLQLAGNEDPRGRLTRFLGGKSLLLVLDNFEHLTSQAAVIGELLHAAPGVRILLTSRQRLGVYGELLVPLRGLSYPAADGPVREEEDSIVLFLNAARRVLPEFEPTEDELGAIGRICRFVQGVPLAVELAAAWVGVLSCEEIAVELQQEKQDLLSDTLLDIPERHRSLRAVFEWSWRLLEESERRAFARLAVFPAGFTRGAAEEVAGATLRDLSRLCEKSLVERRAGNRFEIIQVLRQYAMERLSESLARSLEVAERHALLYASMLEGSQERLVCAESPATLHEIGLEIDNIRQAWRWMVRNHRVDEIARSFQGLHDLYQLRGWAREGEEAFGASVRELRKAPGAADSQPLLLHRLALCQAAFCSKLGNFSLAKRLLHEALDAFRESDAHHDIATALHHLAGIALNQGEHDGAEVYVTEGLRISREISDRLGVARAASTLGVLALSRGDLAGARSHLEESMRLYRALGYQRGVATVLKNLGGVAFELRAYEDAEGYLRESLAIDRAWGDLLGIANSLQNLGCVAFRAGHYQESERYLAEAVSICREMGFRRIESFCLTELANLFEAQSRYEEAQRLYHEAMRAAREIDAIPLLMEVLVGYSRLLQHRGDSGAQFRVLETVFNHPSAQEDTRRKALAVLRTLYGAPTDEQAAERASRSTPPELESTVASLLREELPLP